MHNCTIPYECNICRRGFMPNLLTGCRPVNGKLEKAYGHSVECIICVDCIETDNICPDFIYPDCFRKEKGAECYSTHRPFICLRFGK